MRFLLQTLVGAGILAIAAVQAAEPIPDRALKLRISETCEGCATSTPRAMQPSATEAIVTLSVNLEPKGDFIVLVAQNGDVLIREQDVRTLGLSGFTYVPNRIEDVNYVSLRSVRGLEYDLDETTLELQLRVAVRNLANRQLIDLGRQSASNAIRPAPGGAFINYNLTASGSDRSGSGRLSAAGEIGAHFGDFLFISDGVVIRDGESGRTNATRLSTSLVRDRPDTLQRLVIGDFVTTPGALGSSLRLGGLSFSRRFSLDPYLVRFPGQIVSGSAALPSEIFLYSNGVLLRRDRIAPGAFQLQNLVNLNGLQVTEVVIRDVLGGEQRIVNPFYFSDSLLRRGLDEYSADVGFERQSFGTRSGDYGKLGGTLFYRRGQTDNLTLGVRGEALGDRINMGPSANFRLGVFGISSAALDYGHAPNASGAALSLSHSYQDKRFGSSIALKSEQRDHPQVASFALASRLELAGIVSFPVAVASSVSVSHSRRDSWDGATGRSSAVSFRRSFGRDVSFSMTARNTAGVQAGSEIVLTLSVNFDRLPTRPTISAQSQNAANTNMQTLQVSGGSTDSEGVSYRMNYDKGTSSGTQRETFNPFVQYNFSNAIGRAEYILDEVAGTGSYQFGLSGALAGVAGQWGASRPISDSFGMVSVGNLPGIRVYANNLEIGRTRENGTLFVPRMASYFENPIAIEDRDLPMNITVPEVRYIVMPALRSGTLIDFRPRRVQAVAGRLVLEEAQRPPVGNGEGSIMVSGNAMPIYTSRTGEFYLEDIGAGEYTGRVLHSKGECEFSLNVPSNEETVFELGSVDCHATH